MTLPTPPGPPPRARLPMISALAPLLMAGAMIYSPLLFGGQPNYLYGLFMAFSPVMVVASYVESRRSGRWHHRAEVAEFHRQLSERERQLEERAEAEIDGRKAAAPPSAALESLVAQLSPRLWQRGRGDPDELQVRVGLADQPSLTVVEVPEQGVRELVAEAVAVARRFATVPQVPVVAPIAGGGLGLSGPADHTVPLGYSVVAQLACHHSPAELVLAALMPGSAAPEWEWLKWLPHCPLEGGPVPGALLASSEVECRRLLAELLALIDTRRQARSGALRDVLASPAVVVVIVEGVPVEQHELTRLLEQGPEVEVNVLWMAGASRRVPRPVATVVELELVRSDPQFPAHQGLVRAELRRSTLTRAPAGGSPVPVPPVAPAVPAVHIESLSRAEVEVVARRLAPVTDISSALSARAEIPSRVELAELLGGSAVLDGPDLVAARWATPSVSLAAPVGRMSSEVFTLDIRRDGPHCLVAGTTGAGKSELLQTWISSLAATHSPSRVTFLLVDYKGGAAFKDCANLPHSVGMVTDLDAAGVTRALVSLRAELTRRERILHDNDCADLLEMLDKGLPQAPPSLLIIVDEFAALVQEVPEFIDGVVGVAQRGRSLGLHLILATQRPAGIISGQLKANTDLRIALRVADVEDSTDVIDAPDAAHIDRSLPGRAIARIGPRDRLPFQTAYVGGFSRDDDTAPVIEVSRLELGARYRLAPPPGRGPAPVPSAHSDLERLVATIGRAQEASGQPLPRKPWLAPLALAYDLSGLPAAPDDSQVVLGLADRPSHQDQVPFHFNPDRDGSLGVIGTGGSGKTVALRTIAASVALSGQPPGQVPFVYCLDYAGRGLRPLESLPHVGDVIAEDDPERARRLLTDLDTLLDQRAEAFSAVGAASLAEYRRARPDVATPRTYVLIDGYPSFHQAHETVEQDRWVNVVRRLVAEGRPFGIHVVLSAPRRETIFSAVARGVGRWLVLRQTNVEEYRNLDVPHHLLHAGSPPGRAVERADEAQVAILGGRSEADTQMEAMQDLGQRLAKGGVASAPPVRLLPAVIVPAQAGDPAAVAVRDRDFAPWRWPAPVRAFLVSGPRFSGRSSALRTIGRAAGAGASVVHLLAAKAPAVAPDPGWQLSVGLVEVDEVVQRLLDRGRQTTDKGAPGGPCLVLIDDANALADSGVAVDQLVDAADGRTLTVVAALDDTAARRSSYDALARVLSAGRLGLLLQPSALEDAEVFGTALPRVRSHLWPPGRGYLVSGRSLEVVQVVLTD